jgi:hypothetical protein
MSLKAEVQYKKNGMKKQIIFFTFALFTLALSGCKYDFILPVPEEPQGNGNTNPVSFATQVYPILTNCTVCHGSGKSPDFSASAAYSSVSKLVNTASPAQSKIYTVPSPDGSHGMKYKTSEAALLLKWITEGAKNN